VDVARLVARERDQAQGGVLRADLGDRRDAVEPRHVQVDHERVGLELAHELRRAQAVGRGRLDGERRMLLDQRPERFEEALVVVREDDPDDVLLWLGGPRHGGEP
jgi:hypothetical protein